MSVSADGMNGPARRILRHVWPVAAIGCAVVGIAGALPLFQIAANRLVVGTPVSAAAAIGVSGLSVSGLCLLGSTFLGFGRSRPAALTALAIFAAALVLFAAGLGTAASDLVAGQPPAARAQLATGAWVGLAVLCASVAVSAGRTRIRGVGWLTVVSLLAVFALLYRSGVFDGLSLAVEYRARAESVHAALWQHVVLSFAAVALATVSCVSLYAWRPGRGAIEIVINGLQVVPAVALLGGSWRSRPACSRRFRHYARPAFRRSDRDRRSWPSQFICCCHCGEGCRVPCVHQTLQPLRPRWRWA